MTAVLEPQYVRWRHHHLAERGAGPVEMVTIVDLSGAARARLFDDLSALALPPECTLRVDDLEIRPHTIERYRERVEQGCKSAAERQLRRLILDAHWYPVPQQWTQIPIRASSHYGYTPRRPDVCLVERGGVVRTVLSRRFLEQSGPAHSR